MIHCLVVLQLPPPMETLVVFTTWWWRTINLIANTISNPVRKLRIFCTRNLAWQRFLISGFHVFWHHKKCRKLIISRENLTLFKAHPASFLAPQHKTMFSMMASARCDFDDVSPIKQKPSSCPVHLQIILNSLTVYQHSNIFVLQKLINIKIVQSCYYSERFRPILVLA